MALPRNINTLEQKKFGETAGGEVYVRTNVDGGNIETNPTGLTVGGLVTEVTLNASTWTPLPATPLTGRNAITIQNESAVSIKLNYSSGVAGYVGVTVGSGNERYYDITDDIIIYAKAASGTPTVTIEEIS